MQVSTARQQSNSTQLSGCFWCPVPCRCPIRCDNKRHHFLSPAALSLLKWLVSQFHAPARKSLSYVVCYSALGCTPTIWLRVLVRVYQYLVSQRHSYCAPLVSQHLLEKYFGCQVLTTLLLSGFCVTAMVLFPFVP